MAFNYAWVRLSRKIPPGIPLHLEHADDIDFLIKPDADLERIKAITRETLDKYGLTINSEKTEVATYDGQSNLQKVKKLGTILDESTSQINQPNREDHDYFSHDWRPNTYGHDYARRPHRFVPLHNEYADDVYFL